jgi:hypothetical protein
MRTVRCGKFGNMLMLAAMAAVVGASPASACACGCGNFEIGNLFPNQQGAAVFAEYDFMDQSRNWSGGSQAPAGDNEDKDIRTDFVTLGGQYLFASGFGARLEVPFWNRHFATTESGSYEAVDNAALGDIRLTAVYSGFLEDRSTGVTVGVKFASGDFTDPRFDRDTAIGSGSTDLMLGAYRRGSFDTLGTWRYFLQARYQLSVATQGGYHPGSEWNGVAGVSYDAGLVGGVDIAPMLQLIGSIRRHDGGWAADPLNSGYSQILVSPGVDLGFGNWVAHADVELPVFRNVVGNQLVAPVLLKLSLAYLFE